jgi:membrane protein implicated in regulation of membrane protease activity
MGSPRLFIVISAATVLVVGGVVSLATGSWWFLIVALAAHAVGTLVVLAYTMSKVADDKDKPDPVTEARIEEEESGATT